MQDLWKLNVINGLVVATDDQSLESYSLFNWFPYANGRCGNNQDTINKIGICGVDNNHESYRNAFPEKISNNLNYCRVRVTTHIIPIYVLPPLEYALIDMKQNMTEGTEILLLNTVAQHVNISLEYRLFERNESWGQVLPNKTTTGMLLALARGDADIVIGGYAPATNRLLLYDVSKQYYYDEMKFIVHRAKLKAKWKSLTIIFSYVTWILLLSSFTLASTVMHFITKLEDRADMNLNGISKTYLQHWGSIFVISVKFTRSRMKTRAFFLLWVICSFFLNAAYQTSLISVLTQPGYEHQVSNINEIVEENYEIVLNYPITTYIKQWTDQPVFKAIYDRSTLCTPIAECHLIVNRNPRSATPVSYTYYLYESWIFRDSSGKSRVYVFNEKILVYITVMYMT